MKVTYRPDIDGLRAIAVLLVIFYHLELGWFPGGFVGVDVFFVISGFLITSIIKQEIEGGVFTLRHFYQRRIKRIAPAFIFLAIVVTLAGYIFLLPQDLVYYAQSLFSTLLLGSNIFFFNTTGGYFDTVVTDIPLIHMWSIAVEEQFYLLWPLTMIGLAKCNRRLALSIVALVFLVSLGYAEFFVRHNQAHAYYLFPARVFELMAGAYLALVYQGINITSRWLSHVLSIIGMVLVVGGALALNKNSPFPGIHALYPCIGAVLLILSGKNPRSGGIINIILQTRPFVFVGLLSYSLYLWHWPLIAFSNYRGVFQEETDRAFILIVIFAISMVSYYCVEYPLRKNITFDFRKTFAFIYLIPLCFAALFYIFITLTEGLGHRQDDLLKEFSEKNHSGKTRSSCNSSLVVKLQAKCMVGDPDGPLVGFLLGDSFANANWAFLDVLAKDAGVKFEEKTLNATPPFPGVSFGIHPDESIQDITEDFFNASKRYPIVVLSADWSQYDAYYKNKVHFEGENKLFYRGEEDATSSYRDLLDNAITDYRNAGVKVVLIEAVHRGNFPLIQAAKKDNKDISLPVYKTPQNPRRDYVITQMLVKHPEVIYIDPNVVLCTDQLCDMQIDGTVLYRDNAHVNSLGSRLLGEKYLAMMGNPLKKEHVIE